MTRPHPGDTGPAGPGPEPAPFSLRATARFIDIVLATTAISVLLVLAALPAAALPLDGSVVSGFWAGLVLFGGAALLFLYEWLFLVARGATPGKMMTGIAVVGPGGDRPTRGQAALRAAVLCLPQSLPCVGLCFTLVESLGAVSPGGLTLHDRTARTAVVRVPDAPAAP
ncbi:RDD family protein [Nocardiopsis sp. CC223A]|uniref:RDD family protein n=1 Tax=Nocardiopsis sp. CC223A TaxID=3044051 RepID=UPI00278C66DB|nr:RDD family protein [Nocardiopsis sp. CC223A]